MRFTAILGAVGVVTAAFPLAAQQPDSAGADRPPVWEVALGSGVVVTPAYTGAGEHRLFPFPLTQISYRQRVYLGPSTSGNGLALGAYVVRTPRFALAAEAGVLPDRPASRAGALAGMDDRAVIGTAGISASYTVGAATLGIAATQGLNDGSGLAGAASLSMTQTLGPRIMATAGLSAGVATARQMRHEFGITAAEAARRRSLIEAGDDRLEAGEDAAYRPGAGLHHVGASLALTVLMSDHWALLGFGGAERLGSVAAASPLVRSRSQISGGFGIGYRF